MINTPAADMNPAALEAEMRTLADASGATLEVITGDDLLKANYPMLHAVGRAADVPPRLLDLRWGDEDSPRITLVGKGVCFDTGGLNLKPGDSMELMKKDMGGAAVAIALAGALMEAGLPVRLRVLVGAVENAIGAGAFRPGDVLPSRKGLNVEIGNTDAEGRLILADMLAEADSESPDLIVDLATLTGAARVALGPDLAPFYTRDDALAAALAAEAHAAADPMWRMPLWSPYADWLDSAIADVNHIARPAGQAGSIVAALFLARFVDCPRWVHCDIYGWTIHARSGRPVGGEAHALRALYGLLETRYGKA